MKYLVIYTIHEYSDNGGGTYFEVVESKTEALISIERLMSVHKDKISIDMCCEIFRELEIIPVTYVTRIELK